MKHILCLVLIIAVFAACKKKKSPEPANTLYQYWSLEYASRPFSQDAAWHSSGILATGRTYFILNSNGTYTGAGLLGAAGTFTMQDSAQYKILTLSNAVPPYQRVYVQLVNVREMTMDTRTGPQSESYVRWKFSTIKFGF